MLEFLHVLLLALPSSELLPRPEQIFDGNDIVVWMKELNSSNPPPCYPVVACR